MVEYRRTRWDESDEENEQIDVTSDNSAEFIELPAEELSDYSLGQNSPKQDAAPYAQISYDEVKSFADASPSSGEQQTVKHKKSNKFLKTLVMVLVGAIALGSSAGFGYRYASEYFGKENPGGAYYIQAQQVNAVNTQENANSLPALHEKLKPNIVAITNHKEVNDGFFGTQSVEGSGTGVVFNVGEKEVLLVTNHHVIEGSNEILVAFDGTEPIKANLIGTDADTDIAVVKVNRSDIPEAVLTKLTGVVFGDSDKIKVGESVIALGNPLGYDDTLTGGFISGVDRKLQVDSGKTLSLIQTDAAINPGNSGGALVNLKGEVIGINTIKITNTAGESSVFSGKSSISVEGIGFAIPINDVKTIIDELITKGYVSKPYMGISGKTVTANIAQAYNLVEGIFVDSVSDGSGAQDAGLQKGDIIIDVDHKGIKTIEELIIHIKEKSIGDVLKLKVDRSGEVFETEVELKERTQTN